MTRRPVKSAKPKMPAGLRQRLRGDGTMRIWWEPRADQKAKGFAAVDLGQNLTEAVRKANKLNEDWQQSLTTGKPAARKHGARNIAALIAEFRRSVHWKTRLKPKTRDSYTKMFLQIEDKWGVDLVAEFDKTTMYTWYQALYAERSPRMAQALVAHMSILFKHACLIGWRHDNPCLGLQLATPAARERRLTWAEIDALVAAAEAREWPHMALAIRLSLYQGQRQTDIRNARRGDFALIPILWPGEAEARPGWVWAFRQSKRGTTQELQVHPDVVPHLRRALADAGSAEAPLTADDFLLIDPATGQPIDEFLFSKRFATIRADAAAHLRSCRDVQFRDLRRTFSMLARASGVSDADTADALGNTAASNAQLRQVYMPTQLSTTSRAVAAIKRPETGRAKKEKQG